MSALLHKRPVVLISFSLENDRSALATVTGRVRNRAHTVVNSGTDAAMWELSKSLKTSNTELCDLSSSLNSRQNEHISKEKSILGSGLGPPRPLRPWHLSSLVQWVLRHW